MVALVGLPVSENYTIQLAARFYDPAEGRITLMEWTSI